jgi:uncharacterized protein YbcC (UPF0753/DUF2309 family)
VDTADPLLALALKASDFTAKLNQQTLKVSRLAAGSYKLSIDGAAAGTFTAAQLAAGVNLAELPTPMRDQAAAVHALTLQRAAIHNTRWRQVQVPLEKSTSPELHDALKALDQLASALRTQQRVAAQPLAHSYELTPQ